MVMLRVMTVEVSCDAMGCSRTERVTAAINWCDSEEETEHAMAKEVEDRGWETVYNNKHDGYFCPDHAERLKQKGGDV